MASKVKIIKGGEAEFLGRLGRADGDDLFKLSRNPDAHQEGVLAVQNVVGFVEDGAASSHDGGMEVLLLEVNVDDLGGNQEFAVDDFANFGRER